jgi:hypothetical protein
MFNAVLVRYTNEYGAPIDSSWATDSGSQTQYGKKELVVSGDRLDSTAAANKANAILYFSLRALNPSPFMAPQPPAPDEMSLSVNALGMYATLNWEAWQFTTDTRVDTGTQISTIATGRSGSGNSYIDVSGVSTTGVTINKYRDKFWTLQREIERLAALRDSSDNDLWFQVWEDRKATLEKWGGTSGNFPDPDYRQDKTGVYRHGGGRIPAWMVRADKVIATPGFLPVAFGWGADELEKPSAFYILETSYQEPQTSDVRRVQITPAGWRDFAERVRGDLAPIGVSREPGGRGGGGGGDSGEIVPWDGAIAPLKNIAKSASFTVGMEAACYLVTCGAIGVTVTLPPAADAPDVEYIIFNVDGGAGNITIDPDGAETINGAANYALNNQYDSARISSDGTEWFVTST